MKKYLSIPILIILLSVSPNAFSQKKDSFWRDLDGFLQMRADKAFAKVDSSYIGRYPYRFDARLNATTSGLHIFTEGNETGSVDLSTGLSNRIGLSLGYRGLGLGYSFSLGKTMDIDFNLSSYGRRLAIEYSLRGSSGLTGSVNLYGMDPGAVDGDDLLLFANNLNLIYNINPNFSYSAAMKQGEIQRRSAGSFLIGASWTVWDILLADITDIPRLYYGNFTNYFYTRVSIGAGYGYNLVFGDERWLLHASLIPMWTLFDTTSLIDNGEKTTVRYPMGRVAFCGTARTGIYYRWGTRWSAGISGVVDQMASRAGIDSNSPKYQRFGAQTWQAKFSLSFRF